MGAFNPASFITNGLNLAQNMVSSTLGPFNQAVSLGEQIGLIDDDQDRRRDALRAQQSQTLAQLRQRQRLDETQNTQQAALERQKRAEQARQANQERQAALRRAVARQRAQFGASGIGPDSGSSEAVLLGLFEETEQDSENRQRLDSIRNRSLELNSQQLQARNILESTQRAQRNQLRRSRDFLV